ISWRGNGIYARGQTLISIAPKGPARAVQQRAVVLEDALEGFPGEVETVMLRIAVFQQRDDAQRLNVVVEAAERGHGSMKSTLACMAERCMAEIVAESDSFGQILIESQGPSNRSGNLT